MIRLHYGNIVLHKCCIPKTIDCHEIYRQISFISYFKCIRTIKTKNLVEKMNMPFNTTQPQRSMKPKARMMQMQMPRNSAW